MALTSVPLMPRERWWTRLAKLPGRLWSISRDLATMLTEGSPRQPSKRKLALIRLAMTALMVLLLPVLVVPALSRRRANVFDALHARVRQLWQTSADEAMALLRSTFGQLVAREAFTKMRAVNLAPFGKFDASDVIRVHGFLYDCEIALGNAEAGLAIAGVLPGRLDVTILRQVDCLVALRRPDEAIALLERNLDLDGWRGKLRRRLLELGGRHLRAMN